MASTDTAAGANTAAVADSAAVAAAKGAAESTTAAGGGLATRASGAPETIAAKATLEASRADSREIAKTAVAAGQGANSAGNVASDEGSTASNAIPIPQATVQPTPGGNIDAVAASQALAAAVAVKPKAARSEESSSVDTAANAAASSVADPDASTGSAEVASAVSVSLAAANAISAQAATALSQAAIEKHVHAADAAATSTATSIDGTTSGAAQLNAGAASASTGAPDVAPTATLQVHANVESAGFAQGLSEKVSWMVGNGVTSARLQVNPPQLGPIELSISVTGDHAQVSMVTHSAVARDALESSSPALKDMLGSQGFGQVSVDISQRSFQDRSAYTPPSYDRSSSSNAKSAMLSSVASNATVSTRISTSVLDAYA